MQDKQHCIGRKSDDYHGFVVAPLRLASIKGDVMAIIHAFQPSTQSHPQIKRVFGSASEVDPLRLKKKTRQNVPRRTKPARKKHAQPQTIAPIYENKHRHPTPQDPCFVSTQEPMKATITKKSDTIYSVKTDVLLSDGTCRADHHTALYGNVLTSKSSQGIYRIDGLLAITLGPKSLPLVLALSIGQSVSL